MFGPHRGFGGPHVMMGPHHIGVGVVVPPPRPVIIGDPYIRPPPPPMYGYGYGPRYYDDGEVVCCCGIF